MSKLDLVCPWRKCLLAEVNALLDAIHTIVFHIGFRERNGKAPVPTGQIEDMIPLFPDAQRLESRHLPVAGIIHLLAHVVGDVTVRDCGKDFFPLLPAPSVVSRSSVQIYDKIYRVLFRY